MSRMMRTRHFDLVSEETAVSADYDSPSQSLDGFEDNLAVELFYDGGSSVNMAAIIEVSMDGSNFVEVSSTSESLSAASARIIWTLSFWAPFIRVSINRTGGSLNIQTIKVAGQKRV